MPDPCVPTISGDGRINCDIRALDTAFIDAIETLESVIRRKFRKVPNVYRNRIGRGAYQLGMGLEKSIITHHAGMGDQAGLTSWDQIKVSDPDEPFDACRYQAQVVDSGFSRVNYTGYTTSRRTKNICLNDIKWTWEYNQQIEAYFSFLADVTARIWETWGRENYLMFCTAYVLSEGGADAVEVTYNPRTSTNVTLPGVKISTLKWDYLTWYHQMLALGAPEAALSNSQGFPLFGLVLHPKDWHDMIETDTKLRETYNYAAPQTLLDHYGSVDTFKGFMIIGDMEAPRWRIEGVDGSGNYICTRIVPYVQKKTTKGAKWVQNPDYVNAEIALGVIFLNDVYTTLVPPVGPAKIGGAEFGTVPGLMGDFRWLNIQDDEKNPLRENGYYFARYQAFAEPGENHTEPICFFYRRCTNIAAGECESDSVGSSSAVAITGITNFVTPTLVDVGDEITMAIEGEEDATAAYEILPGELGFTVAADLKVNAGDNVTLYGASQTTPTAYQVKMASADGKAYVIICDLDSTDIGSASVKAEGPLEWRMTLAGELACGVGAEVTVTDDDTAGNNTFAGVLSVTENQPEYVISFASGAVPTFAVLTVGDGPTVTCV